METIISEDQRKIMNLFDLIIMDMYNIIVKILPPEKMEKAKSDVFNRLSSEQTKNINRQTLDNRPYFMLSVLDVIFDNMEKTKKIMNPKLFTFIKLFLDSAVKLNDEECQFDEISNKNIYSLIINGYCCLECLTYLIQKGNELNPYKKSFDDSNYKNLHNYLESNSFASGIKSIFNSFQTQFFKNNNEKAKTKEGRDTLYYKFLKSVKETDFKDKYEANDNKVKAAKKKKRDKKKEKNQNKDKIILYEKTNIDSLNSISSIQKDNYIVNQINESQKKDDEKQQDLGSIASILIEAKPKISNEAIESINVSMKDFKELIKKVISEDLKQLKKDNFDLKKKFTEYGSKNALLEEQLSKVNKEIDTIKKNNNILMENQDKLWNYITCFPMEGT